LISILQKEREEGIRRDHEEEENFVKQAMEVCEEEDKLYLKYADEIIEDCTKKGRCLYPILHAREVSYQTEHSDRKKVAQ
jgi:DNA replication protein DnaD